MSRGMCTWSSEGSCLLPVLPGQGGKCEGAGGDPAREGPWLQAGMKLEDGVQTEFPGGTQGDNTLEKEL